ncbi:MAG TPA: adenylate/guanylate cyclase domain-containing protein, partial [Tepidisphaeraceae bacterium]|nr:adenylate/guanylate cyclase domain-containing protein [Tepidisphaeraceae bacterium]
DELFGSGITDPTALHEKLTPTAFKRDLKTDASVLLDQTLTRVQSVRNILRFTTPIPPDAPPLTIAENEQAITIPILTGAIHYCGYVDFLKSADGVVRSIPLFVNYRGRMLPHMAMATACAILDVDLNKIQFTENTVSLPLPSGQHIIIPVRTAPSSDLGRVGTFMDIPWFGTKEWRYSYDIPAHQDSKQHIPLNTVWRVCELRRDLESIGAKTDDALKAIVQVYRSSLNIASKFVDEPADQRDDAQRAAAIKDVVDQIGSLIDLSTYDKMKPSDYSEDEKLFVPAYRALIQAQKSLQIDTDRIQKARTELRSQLNGRAAIIGWTATGNTDTYSTSIHAACPGVVIQGMAINGILTRDLWRPAPWWITVIITFFIGILGTLSVAWFQPKQAMVCTVGLIAAYFVINGILIFDWGKTIVGIAAPLTTGFAVWSTLTLVRYISETALRRRITNKFRSYADPQLVNYVMEHIDTDRLDGQVKMMTVVFTDLAGFTTISEKLRERTVPLLNEYMSLMLPIIRENNGLWNKFLGDGIMFFFNAPLDNPHHARDAVRTVMEMQHALIDFNKYLAEKELPAVAMRAGVSTGPMIVGDAGSTHEKHGASDYTVLGDEVNLGARLESANKYLGSRTLLNQAAAELCGDEFLLRPMGNICVAGKSEGVHCFDAICRLSEATDAQKRLAELSTLIVKNFRESEFAECIRWAEQLKKSFGPSKFADLYLSLASLYLSEPPGEKFDGQIVLSEK